MDSINKMNDDFVCADICGKPLWYLGLTNILSENMKWVLNEQSTDFTYENIRS